MEYKICSTTDIASKDVIFTFQMRKVLLYMTEVFIFKVNNVLKVFKQNGIFNLLSFYSMQFCVKKIMVRPRLLLIAFSWFNQFIIINNIKCDLIAFFSLYVIVQMRTQDLFLQGQQNLHLVLYSLPLKGKSIKDQGHMPSNYDKYNIYNIFYFSTLHQYEIQSKKSS